MKVVLAHKWGLELVDMLYVRSKDSNLAPTDHTDLKKGVKILPHVGFGWLPVVPSLVRTDFGEQFPNFIHVFCFTGSLVAKVPLVTHFLDGPASDAQPPIAVAKCVCYGFKKEKHVYRDLHTNVPRIFRRSKDVTHWILASLSLVRPPRGTP